MFVHIQVKCVFIMRGMGNEDHAHKYARVLGKLVGVVVMACNGFGEDFQIFPVPNTDPIFKKNVSHMVMKHYLTVNVQILPFPLFFCLDLVVILRVGRKHYLTIKAQ